LCLFGLQVNINNFEGGEMKMKRYVMWAFALITSVLTICLAEQEPNPDWLMKMSQDEKGLQFLKEYFLPFIPEPNMSQDEALALMQYAGNSLKDLRGVTVLVEFLNPEAEEYGLTRKSIQTDSELRLRQSGIKVIPLNEHSLLDATLYINVGTVLSDEFPNIDFRIVAVNIQVEVRQRAMLYRDPKIWCSATMWKNGHIVLCEVSKLRSGVKEILQDKIDEFINDFLAANPKK
jgi:hypothetical protein